jgi:hypothetical protein
MFTELTAEADRCGQTVQTSPSGEAADLRIVERAWPIIDQSDPLTALRRRRNVPLVGAGIKVNSGVLRVDPLLDDAK